MSTLFHRLQDGRQHWIIQGEYEEFIDTHPPVFRVMSRQEQQWNSGFAEGVEHFHLLRVAIAH